MLSIKKFKSLTRAQQRVLVAKDVIKSLDAKEYKAESGTYCKTRITEKMEKLDVKENLSLLRPCTVCAIGAALVSSTKFANMLTFNDLADGQDPSSNKASNKLLCSIFPKAQLAMMEACFEGTSYTAFGNGWDSEKGVIGDEYTTSNPNTGKRMRAIFNNVARNNGSFKPKQDIKKL